MYKVVCGVRFSVLLILLISQVLVGCVAHKNVSNPDTRRLHAVYDIVAQPGVGAGNSFYSIHVFPALKMSSSGVPIQKMTPKMGGNGEIKGWKTGGSVSSNITQKMESHLKRDGYGVLSFSELLDFSDPYTVMVVSAFYTTPTEVKGGGKAGLDRMVTVKVKGAYFGLDLDPSKSLPVGTVQCTGYYSSTKHHAQSIISKLLAEATKNLGDELQGYGTIE